MYELTINVSLGAVSSRYIVHSSVLTMVIYAMNIIPVAILLLQPLGNGVFLWTNGNLALLTWHDDSGIFPALPKTA